MGNLLAGAAMRKITPTIEQIKAINAEDKSPISYPYDGIHEDIYVRAIVLSDGVKKVLLGASDIVKFPGQQKLNDRLAKEYGIDPLGCLLSCTHNHESIYAAFTEGDDESMRDTPPAGPAMDAYAQFVHDMMAEAVGEAIAKLQPARMGVIKGTSFINACRDLPTPIGGVQANNFHGPSDHELTLLRFDALNNNETIAMFVNHATHSNAMVWNLYDGSYAKVGADVGGGISRFVEKANNNKFPVAWAMGCAGDQNPIVRSSWRIVDIDDEGKLSMNQVTFDYMDSLLQMKSLIATQGLEILELSGQIKDFTYEFSFKGAETWRTIPSRQSYRSLKIQPMCGERPEPVPYHKPLTFRFRLAQICGVGLATINGEIYSRLGLMIKRMMPCETTLVATLCYGGMGYIPDAESEKAIGYGTMGTYAISGAHTEAAFIDGFTELREKVFGK